MKPKTDNTELLQQLMDNMTDNIFFKDLDSRFIMMNNACAQWNGFDSPMNAIGKCDFDLFTEEFARSARNDEIHIYETGEPLECKEEHAEWEDGHLKWVSTSKIPMRDKDGNIVGCIGIGRDITELKHKEAEQEEVSGQLRKSNEQLRLVNEQVAEDLRMAARLQQTFLPHNYPIFHSQNGRQHLDFQYYYEAESEIGGDYCTIHKLDDHRAGLLICDAMGHGVRAALITGIIRALVADNLVRTTGTAGELTGASAGHPAPYLISSQQGEASLLPIGESTSGPALAIVDDHEYDTFSIQMNPGDKIPMYTDGISEASDDSGEEFGASLLQKALQENSHLPLSKLLPNLIETARKHTGSDKIGDDTCLLGFTLYDITGPT